MIKNWRRQINLVARQEMLHLGLVSNLLAAIGGAPYFRRGKFAHTSEETAEQRHILSNAFLNLMSLVVSPLGSALTKPPAGFDEQTAGLSFEIYWAA
ncbi:MAG: ferritin-like domain-containing protein [Blastocatellia bacterium]